MGIFKGKRRTNRANYFDKRSRHCCRKPKNKVNNCNLRTDNQMRGTSKPKIITSTPKPTSSIRRKRVFVYRPITATPTKSPFRKKTKFIMPSPIKLINKSPRQCNYTKKLRNVNTMSPSNAGETWEYLVLTDNDFDLNDKPSIQIASNKKITKRTPYFFYRGDSGNKVIIFRPYILNTLPKFQKKYRTFSPPSM